ncbi:cell envelope integrity protein TolA [Curvibacter sp. APW13]|uniref:cell envelope integrity protein TolA n=1 Tax=Curvibacter sp. APW13 TaxID=3077236 RepID=UPI0028DE9FEB|nr:cell envelope integrity protein TolA [Curvibacter sp. APW13]MDT8991400.1 cell envelope integrity protein TolA [Curvibacter sp. APW13]
MAQAVQHEFAPPAPRGLGLALLLALLAHGLLALILTAGVQWKRSAPQVLAVEAELWAAVPTQAAPAAPLEVPEETAPTTPPLPPAPVEPAPAPTPVTKTPAPDITLAKEKERLKKEEQQRQELEKQKQEKLKLEKEKQAKDKAEKERLEKEKLAKEKDRQKDSQQAKLEAAKREKEEARRLEEIRQQNLKRMAGLAASGGGTGDAKSTGTAAQSAGPSAGYAGRIRAKVYPNIVFMGSVPINAATEVEVRTSPDGTILSQRVVQSSGVKAWDEAVLRGLEKTEVLPKDTDGRVPSPMIISFRHQGN